MVEDKIIINVDKNLNYDEIIGFAKTKNEARNETDRQVMRNRETGGISK